MPATHPAKKRDRYKDISDMTSKVFRGYFDFRDWMERWENHPNHRPECHRTVEVEGQIVSHANVVDIPVRCGDSVLRLGGIGNVATHGDFQGRGYAAEVMRDAVRFMVEEGIHISLLFGIENFYHKFGYRSALAFEWLSIATKELKCNAPTGLSIRKMKKTDIPALAELFEKKATEHLFSPVRTESIWHWYWKNGEFSTAQTVWDGDSLVAYTVMRPSGDKLVALEVITEDRPDAYDAALYICLKRARKELCSDIEIHSTPDGEFARYSFYRKQLKTVRSTGYKSGAMMRIISQPQLFEALEPVLSRRWTESLPGETPTVSLSIKSPLGTVGLTADRSGVRVDVDPKGDLEDSELIKISLEGLTELVVGHRPADMVLAEERITLSDKTTRAVNILFPRRAPFFPSLDHF